MPYLLSTQGPKITVGDVNGDTLEDFFIGGASKQAGALFIQNTTGTFTQKKASVFEQDRPQEDIATLFFDADQDGDLDLYVGSGGNEFYQKNEYLKDRLYINDGKGNFTKKETALPAFFNQTSCVLPADIDQDGDVDLFVGSRSIPVNYGLPPDSYLLLNDGQGNFTDATQKVASELKNVGMVTDATWSDIDGDNDPDLMIVGEWMPIKIFKNEGGQLTLLPSVIPNSEGLWNCIQATDIDQDGDEDFILGNWGLNSNLQATNKAPIRLYIKDFDKNLSKDAILTYHQQGKEYPLAGLDELSSQLVYLKKKYRQYEQFSKHTFREIFPLEDLKGAMRLEAFTLESAVLLNKGNSQFELQALPIAAQIAPVHGILTKDFDQDGHIDVLLGGNFHEVQPAIGKMDASYGTFLKGKGDGTFEVLPNNSIDVGLTGQVRDMVPIRINGQVHFLVARNNESVQVFR